MTRAQAPTSLTNPRTKTRLPSTIHSPSPAIPFFFGELEGSAGGLHSFPTRRSSDLVPDGNIVFGGSGPNRTLTLMPATNQSGTTTITITVSDPEGASASRSFVLTVSPVNDQSTSSNLTHQSTDEDTPTLDNPFSIARHSVLLRRVGRQRRRPALFPYTTLFRSGAGWEYRLWRQRTESHPHPYAGGQSIRHGHNYHYGRRSRRSVGQQIVCSHRQPG